MARKRPAQNAQPEQLVLPLQLRIGDIVLEAGTRLEVVDRPTTVSGGKLTRVAHFARLCGFCTLLRTRAKAEGRIGFAGMTENLPW